MSRPELQTPPELFYNEKMSRKYNSNSRMVGIQAEISDRCIELLNIPVREEGAPKTDRPIVFVCVGLWRGVVRVCRVAAVALAWRGAMAATHRLRRFI